VGIQSIICYSNLTETSDPLKDIFGELTYRLEFSNSYQPIIETHLIKAPSKIEKEVLSPSTDIVTLKSCQPNTSDTEELAIDQPAKKQRVIKTETTPKLETEKKEKEAEKKEKKSRKKITQLFGVSFFNEWYACMH